MNSGGKTISLLGENEAFTELPVPVFEQLAREGRIQGSPAKQEPGRRPEVAVLAAASEEDLSVANRRFGAVLRYLRGESPLAYSQVSARTVRSWVSLYRKAAACLGSGYLGLLPRRRERGNRRSRLAAETRTLLQESIEHDYETLKQKMLTRKLSSYGMSRANRNPLLSNPIRYASLGLSPRARWSVVS